MIDERMEEQACLHVLGALSPVEAAAFKKAMEADPELKAYVARLTGATGALAGTVPLVEPPPQLRAKVLAHVAPRQKVVTLPERKATSFSWLSWVLAGGFAVVCLILGMQDSQLRKTVDQQASQMTELTQLAQTLQSATNSLQQTVVALQESNRLAGLKIAMLDSLLTDSPKTVAVTVWDADKQNGEFVVQNIKALPTDRDYELWVLDEGTKPVAAGTFHPDETGTLRMHFKPSESIKRAGVFAVTEEVKGGVTSPTLKNLVLASK